MLNAREFTAPPDPEALVRPAAQAARTAGAGGVLAAPGVVPWRTTSRILVLASGFSMAASLAVAAHHFPGSYDSRHRVISQILAPRSNPAWYWLAALGVGIGACLLLPAIAHLSARVRMASPPAAGGAALGLGGGSVALIAAVLVPEQNGRLLNLTHQIFAGACALGIQVGILCCVWCAGRHRSQVFGGCRRVQRALALGFGVLTALAFAGLAFGSGVPHPALPAPVARVWPPMLWELGYWEWTWSGLVYLFFLCTVLL